mgnify:CR=1 FL=1
MTKKRILFVVNPVSGGKKKTAFNKQVLEVLDLSRFEPTFKTTNHVNHAYELAIQAIEEKYDAVIAVGGDGTVLSSAHFLDHGTIPLLGINSDPISEEDKWVRVYGLGDM